MRGLVLIALLAQSAHAAQRLAAPACSAPPQVTVEVKPFTLTKTAPEDSTETPVSITGRIIQPPNCTTIGATFQGYQAAEAPNIYGPVPVGPDGTFSTIVNVPNPQDGNPISLTVRVIIRNEAGTGTSAPATINLPER